VRDKTDCNLGRYIFHSVFSTAVSKAFLNILTTILNTRCTTQSGTRSQTLQNHSQLYCCTATDDTARFAVRSPALKHDRTPAADNDGRSAVISSALKKIFCLISQFLTVVVASVMVFWVLIQCAKICQARNSAILKKEAARFSETSKENKNSPEYRHLKYVTF